MTEATHTHEWGPWQPNAAAGRDTIARRARWCTVWACDSVDIRPIQDTALGRCQSVLQCHRETGHAGGHEAREAG